MKRRLVLVVAALLSMTTVALGGKDPPRGKTQKAHKAAAPREEPPVEVAPPVPVPPLHTKRVDGLTVIFEKVEGPAVAARLVVSFHGVRPAHPTPGIAPVVANAALYGAGVDADLGRGGAGRVVQLADNSIVLGVDTLRERFSDDVGALISAASQPVLNDVTLAAARARITPFGTRWSNAGIFDELTVRLMPHDVAIAAPSDDLPVIQLDSAVFHVEEMWSAERMTLIVAGDVPAEELDKLVEKHFLVPAGPPADPQSAVAAERGKQEDVTGRPPSFIAYGQWARDVRAADAVVLAEIIRIRLESETPQSGDCEVRYLPARAEPIVLAVCGAVSGSALDVREALKTALDGAAAETTPPEQLAMARQSALARLKADRTSAALMAERLGAWAAAGLDGGPGLEQAVQATTDAQLVESFKQLTAPERAIRVHRTAKAE